MVRLIDTLDYLVFSYFFIDIQVMRKWAEEFFSEEQRREKYSIDEGKLDLSIVRLGKPYSGGAEKINAVIYQAATHPGHCVFISNSGDGWFTLINRICGDLKIKCISVATTLDNVVYPFNCIRVYECGRDIRLVRTMLEGDRWDFFEKGTVQPFEDTSNYRKKKIRDRLKRAIITDYLRQASLDIGDDRFWQSEVLSLYIREHHMK